LRRRRRGVWSRRRGGGGAGGHLLLHGGRRVREERVLSPRGLWAVGCGWACGFSLSLVFVVGRILFSSPFDWNSILTLVFASE
jgi:predicted metal-binding membrane protein